uniref:Uncharacterized protein n=1 Tax=Salmonella phage PMBT18 TaxID=3229742 RepID=A0AB39C175_9CAUD
MPCRPRRLHILDTGGRWRRSQYKLVIKGSSLTRRTMRGRTKGKPETGAVFSSSQNSDHPDKCDHSSIETLHRGYQPHPRSSDEWCHVSVGQPRLVRA